MKLAMQVGLGPGYIVLDKDPALLLQIGTVTQFSAHICCGQMAGWIKMPLGREIGHSPGHIMLDGDPAPACGRGTAPPFQPMSIVTTVAHISYC